MRVLMLTQFYAPTVGGQERMVDAMSAQLAGRGHDVAVATLGLPGEREHDVFRGLPVYRIAGAVQRIGGLYREPGRRHAMPAPDPMVAARLLALVRGMRPDVVHGHDWLTHSFLPVRRGTTAAVVLSLHDHSLVCPTKRFVDGGRPCDGPGVVKCLRCSARHYGRAKGVAITAGVRAMHPMAAATVDLFLPVSRAVAERSGLAAAALAHEIVPNFLEPPAAAPDPPVHGLPDDGFIMFAGDATADKGVDVLLDAYAGLRHPPPLVLMGRPYSPRLSPPPPGVLVLGPRPHREITAAWRRCGVAVVPSITPESFGLVALEAAAAGRPVVATRNGGLVDMVGDGTTGLLVEPGDASALRSALERLLADASLQARLGAAGARHARRFTAEAVLPRLEAAYDRATARRREAA